MTKHELKERFKQYAISVARLALSLPYNVVNKNYADQVNRSASSAAANYSASLRAKSATDFIYKFKIVEKELDESLFFLELVEELNPNYKDKIAIITKEGVELLCIIVKALKTSRSKMARKS